MNQLEYLPGIAGQSVQLDGPSAFVGIAEEMRSREWDFDLGYRDLVTATRPARKVDVTFNADYDTADTLRRVADADVMARTPGTFVAQKEWKQRGYILASDVDDIHYGRLSTGLKIALLDGAWWRLAKRSFVPEITTPEYRSATGETVTASGASGAPLHALTVYGKAVQDGTPTPDAPVPAKVVQSINLYNPATNTNGRWINDSGVIVNAPNTCYSGKIAVKVGETYTFAITPIGESFKRVVAYKSDDTFNGLLAKLSQQVNVRQIGTFTIPSDTAYIRLSLNMNDLEPQLELGSTATPYVPYGSIGLNIDDTITPIDLQGNVLASLPDGTKDVLTVDSTGHCVATINAKKLVLDGSTTPTLSSSSATLDNWKIGAGTGTRDWKYSAGSATNLSPRNTISNSYPVVSGGFRYATGPGMSIWDDGYYLRTTKDQFADGAAVQAYLQANPIEVWYQLDTPQTIDLGYIDMPAIPLDAQISVTVAVTPTITAEWQISRDAYLDYPHNYEYDYQATSSTADVTPSVLTPSDVYLAVFGPAVNPYVIVGGNRYQVNVTVPSGGYLVVDGRDKTINLTLADGTVQNVFSSGVRGGGAGGGSYIFERIPAGTSEVTYDGSFGFDLGWYEEEGEPPWSQS